MLESFLLFCYWHIDTLGIFINQRLICDAIRCIDVPFRVYVVSRTNKEITFISTFEATKRLVLQSRATHNSYVEHYIIQFGMICHLYAIYNIDMDRIIHYMRHVKRRTYKSRRTDDIQL